MILPGRCSGVTPRQKDVSYTDERLKMSLLWIERRQEVRNITPRSQVILKSFKKVELEAMTAETHVQREERIGRVKSQFITLL
jgi:hypothetical protein